MLIKVKIAREARLFCLTSNQGPGGQKDIPTCTGKMAASREVHGCGKMT